MYWGKKTFIFFDMLATARSSHFSTRISMAAKNINKFTKNHSAALLAPIKTFGNSETIVMLEIRKMGFAHSSP